MANKKIIEKAETIKGKIHLLKVNGGDEIDNMALQKAYDAIQDFIS